MDIMDEMDTIDGHGRSYGGAEARPYGNGENGDSALSEGNGEGRNAKVLKFENA